MSGRHYDGCIGCVDFARNTLVCDYLLNHQHCRPCRVQTGGGCELYSAIPRLSSDETYLRTWDTAAAARMLAKGADKEEIAAKLGASLNSVKAWIGRGHPVETAPDITVKKAGGVWNETQYRKLYAMGLNDAEAATWMGLAQMTIWKHRNKLGLPPNGRKAKKKGRQI